MHKPLWSFLLALSINLSCLGVAVAALPLDLGGSSSSATPAAESNPSENLAKELEALRSEQARLEASKKEFSGLLQQAPELVRQMRREIGVLEKHDAEPRLPSTLNTMEQAINLLEAQAKALQISLNDVMDSIGEQQSLPSLTREQVAAAQKQINDVQGRLRDLGEAASKPLDNLKREVLRQQLANATLRRDNAQSRLEGYQKLLEMYTVNRDLLLLRLGVIKSTLQALRTERDSLRQQSVEQQQEEDELLQSELAQKHGLVLAELEKNQRLSRSLNALSDDLTSVNDRLAASKQELQELRYRFEMAQQQLELTQAYQRVDDYLVRQRQTLQTQIREQQDDEDLTQIISRTRLDQFKYDDQLRQVRTQAYHDEYVNQLLEKAVSLDPERETEVRRSLQEVRAARAELLARLVEVSANYVVALTNLDLAMDEQLAERERFFEMLNQKLLWRRSSEPLSLDWLQKLPISALWFVSHEGWRQVVRTWVDGFVKPVYPVLGFVAALAALYWPRRRMLQRLDVLRAHIGNVMKDKFRYTAEALVITVLLAAPLPVLTAIAAAPLVAHPEASVFANSVGQALISMAYWIFVLTFIRFICLPNGLAVVHFNWRPNATAIVSRWLPLLYWQIPAAIVYIVVWSEGDEHQAGLLGRAAYLAMAVWFWLYTWRVMSPHSGVLQKDDGVALHWYQRWGRPLYWLAVLVPTALLGLAFEGFNFSAMILHGLMYQTLVLAMMIFVLDQVCMRWFAVQERKLALGRALAKREAMKKAKESHEAARNTGDSLPEVELPSIDVTTISEQNRALLKVLSYSAFAVAMWWTWKDTFQAVNFFNEVVLWQYGSGDGQTPVSLGTVLFTLVAVVLTYVSVKNLPGLIEMVVLQRFGIDSGIRFAITTTARYLVMVSGVMVISAMMGLDWGKLGWLVAALGVGLGFGLQEIFANFISGLIILYERPIRIGDTVTITDLTGTVTRIRMRATTICDWDQKEIIIPNKTFVTSQFINWTLSDDVTRLVLKVGVLVGADTELVTRTLLEIAEANEKVLADPPSTALFLSFDDSVLRFELRVFVDQFRQRMVLMHELNMEINRRFTELGIRLAFPQLDLHVRNLPNTPPLQAPSAAK